MRRGAIRVAFATVIVAVAAGGFAVRATPPASAPASATAREPRARAARIDTAPVAAPALDAEPAAVAPRAPAAMPAPRDTGCLIVSLKRTPTRSELRDLGLAGASRVHGDLVLLASPPAGTTAAEFAQVLVASGLVKSAEPDHLLATAALPADYDSPPNDPDFRDARTWTFSAADGTVTVQHAKSWALRGAGSAFFDQTWPALARDKAGHAGQPAVRVAVIDTGFYFNDHPDLSGNIAAAIDECATYTPNAGICTTDTDVTPVSEAAPGNTAATAAHGTMVASEIGQGTDNGVGSVGAAWDTRVDVYKVQGIAGSDSFDRTILRGQAVIPDSAMVRAIYDATDDSRARGYRLVINMSMVEESPTGTDAMRDAVAYAIARGVVVVAAAGNTGASSDSHVVNYPAAYDGVIAVGATTLNGTALSRASFSSYGSRLDILAPGDNIWGPAKPLTVSTLKATDAPDPNGVAGYDWWRGTSMAAPYVSSAAALLLRVEPTLSVPEVEGYLTGSATDMGVPGWDSEHGWGALDAHNAYIRLVTPVTTSDAREMCAHDSTITLTVADRDSGTNVTTYYQIDGSGPPGGIGYYTGRSVAVTMDASSTKWHTLTFWSEDSNGVVEGPRYAYFRVAEPDLVAPITTCDAAPYYDGRATVRLSCSDRGPAEWIGPDFPCRTFYQLDSGPVTEASALTVGSTGAHSLRYWSVDCSGNSEPPNTVAFTVSPIATRATITRSASTVKHTQHIHLSGTLTQALRGDVVTVQSKSPGSHTWKNFTVYYRRPISSVTSAGRGTWPTLTYTLKKHGYWYFRVVYSGDSSNLSRKSYVSASVRVRVK